MLWKWMKAKPRGSEVNLSRTRRMSCEGQSHLRTNEGEGGTPLSGSIWCVRKASSAGDRQPSLAALMDATIPASSNLDRHYRGDQVTQLFLPGLRLKPRGLQDQGGAVRVRVDPLGILRPRGATLVALEPPGEVDRPTTLAEPVCRGHSPFGTRGGGGGGSRHAVLDAKPEAVNLRGAVGGFLLHQGFGVFYGSAIQKSKPSGLPGVAVQDDSGAGDPVVLG
mmetsp:Transcript_20435/g.56628  ORF Transcript_20435/g.56628 Transcript_20435/m.56628 type:complete len:222 (-) Transcript_20435:552-1217(-)